MLSELAQQQWDMERLTAQVELSQTRRLFLRKALRMGETADWDYAAPDQQVEHCLRGTKIYNQWAYGGVVDFRVP